MRIGLLLPLLALHSGVPAQSWTVLNDLPAIERDDAASFSIGNDLYLGTGMDAGFQLTKDWYRYNTWDNSWQAVSPLPSSARQYAVGFSLDGKGYVQGGIDANGATTQLWMYDPALDAWFARAPLPGTARSAAVAFELEGLAYVIGGLTQGGVASGLTYAYDPVTNAWIARAPFPGTARHRAMAFAANGKGYVFGGADAQFQALQDGWSYDPVTNTWAAVASLPAPRFSADAAPLLGGGIVVGGASGSTTLHDDTWRYDAFADAWSVLPPFPGGPRRGGSSAHWGGVRLYYGTGSDNNARKKDWYVMDIPAGVQDHGLPARMRLAPDPATTFTQLLVPDGPGPMPYRIIDGNGCTVQQARTGPGGFMDVSGLSPGRYTVLVTTDAAQYAAPLLVLPADR